MFVKSIEGKWFEVEDSLLKEKEVDKLKALEAIAEEKAAKRKKVTDMLSDLEEDEVALVKELLVGELQAQRRSRFRARSLYPQARFAARGPIYGRFRSDPPDCECSDCNPDCECSDCNPDCECSDCNPDCECSDCNPDCECSDCDPDCECSDYRMNVTRWNPPFRIGSRTARRWRGRNVSRWYRNRRMYRR